MASRSTPSISTHVLDNERGQPARGCPVRLLHWQGGELNEIGSAATDEDGRIEDLAGKGLQVGSYRIVFEVAEYFQQAGRAAPFLERVAIDFQVDDSARHYHVPLLLTPYACTSYRGS